MKKREAIAFMIMMAVLFLVACSAEPEELREANEAEQQQATEFVTAYKHALVDSINKGTFNIVEPYLIKNTSLYHSLRRYLEELSVKRAKKEIELFEVEKVYVDELNEFYVDVHEKVVLYTGEEEKHIERSVQFHLAEYKDKLRVVNIKVYSTNE